MKGKPFVYVEKQLRKKSFGVISVVDYHEHPHSTGVIYAIPRRPQPFHFYVLTGADYRKTKYIQKNPNVAFMVTFPHYWMRFVPANTVHFQGTAEILPFSDPTAQTAFQNSRITRMNLSSEFDEHEMVFIKIIPPKSLNVYGIGIPIMQMRKDPGAAGYKTVIPEELR